MKKLVPNDAILIPDQAKHVFQGQIFDVYQWPQKLFDGTTETFEMLKRPDTVVAFCLLDNKVLVLDDEQPHTGSRKSLPGGRIDSTDASVEAAAQREILEETGYSFNNWSLIKVVQPHLKIEWFVHLLLAWDVSGKQEPSLDAGEKIQVTALSFEELKQLAINKAGYLGESLSVLDEANSIEQLISLPPFSGQEVDR